MSAPTVVHRCSPGGRVVTINDEMADVVRDLIDLLQGLESMTPSIASTIRTGSKGAAAGPICTKRPKSVPYMARLQKRL